jgi:hypothetical protein
MFDLMAYCSEQAIVVVPLIETGSLPSSRAGACVFGTLPNELAVLAVYSFPCNTLMPLAQQASTR